MRRLLPFALSLCAALAFGCATSAPPAPPPPPASVGVTPDVVDEVLARPDLLFQRAEQARTLQKPELAYRYFALIHELHPESKEDRDAFLWAARIGKRQAEVNLYPDHNSIWVGAERAFLYQWFESIVRDEFSKPHADALLVDATYNLARNFLAYAQTRPALARWQITVEEDNGRVFAVHWVDGAKGGSRTKP